MARKRKVPTFAELAEHLNARLRPPFGIVLGSPAEAAELAASLPEGPAVCFQMDLFQAARLQQELTSEATVHAAADLWDLPDLVGHAFQRARAITGTLESVPHDGVPHGPVQT